MYIVMQITRTNENKKEKFKKRNTKRLMENQTMKIFRKLFIVKNEELTIAPVTREYNFSYVK